MTVIGEIPLKRSLSSSEAVRMSCNPISRVLIKRGNLGTQKDTSIHRGEKNMETQREDGHLQAKERGFRRNQRCCQLEPELLASRSVRK